MQADNIGLSDQQMTSLPDYKDFLPVVVIATHNRTEITKELINSLQKQHENLKVVLVYTKSIEGKYYNAINNPNLHLVAYQNNPLGLKWQAGVKMAKTLNPDCLLILGSDDTISNEYIRNGYELLKKGYHFIGLRRYNVIYQRRIYQLDYKPIMPLGGGRIYSRQLLDKLNWELFEPKERKLDDYGWMQTVKSGMKAICISDTEKYGMEITAIKGAWQMLNPFNPKHPNLTILKVSNVRN